MALFRLVVEIISSVYFCNFKFCLIIPCAYVDLFACLS